MDIDGSMQHCTRPTHPGNKLKLEGPHTLADCMGPIEPCRIQARQKCEVSHFKFPMLEKLCNKIHNDIIKEFQQQLESLTKNTVPVEGGCHCVKRWH